MARYVEKGSYFFFYFVTELLLIDMLLGRYRLGRELGRGAYGVVNEARDFRDGRRSIAIKSLDLSVLPRSETAWTADAIEQEVALMRRLDHPNVVRVFDLVRASGSDRLFIIMELCRGNLPHHRSPHRPEEPYL